MRAVFPGPERHHFVCEVIIEGAAKNSMLTGNDRLNGNMGFGIPYDDGLSVTFFFKKDGIVIRHRGLLTPQASGDASSLLTASWRATQQEAGIKPASAVA
jgi:hypothetical protein